MKKKTNKASIVVCQEVIVECKKDQTLSKFLTTSDPKVIAVSPLALMIKQESEYQMRKNKVQAYNSVESIKEIKKNVKINEHATHI